VGANPSNPFIVKANSKAQTPRSKEIPNGQSPATRTLDFRFFGVWALAFAISSRDY
jgi:hypothetical protein